MSIKVYEAYRLKRGRNPFDVMFDIKARGIKEAKKSLAEFYRMVMDNPDCEWHPMIRKDLKKEDVEKIGYFDIDRWVFGKYGSQLGQGQRNLFHLDVVVTLRRFRNRYYVIPYCDDASLTRGALHFLTDHPDLEEFGYWNNADEPEGMSPQRWAWRSHVWRHLTEPQPWSEFLETQIVSFDGFSAVSPGFDLAQETHTTTDPQDTSSTEKVTQ